MALNPLKLLRDRRRFRAEVREEICFLVERHGAQAQAATVEELKKPGLPQHRARVLQAAARQLKT